MTTIRHRGEAMGPDEIMTGQTVDQLDVVN
jgi:hypothetical protein